MFTDNEVVLAIGYNNSIRAANSRAQRVIDDLDRDVIHLRRQLSAARSENAALKADRGRNNVDMLLAVRAKMRRH